MYNYLNKNSILTPVKFLIYNVWRLTFDCLLVLHYLGFQFSWKFFTAIIFVSLWCLCRVLWTRKEKIYFHFQINICSTCIITKKFMHSFLKVISLRLNHDWLNIIKVSNHWNTFLLHPVKWQLQVPLSMSRLFQNFKLPYSAILWYNTSNIMLLYSTILTFQYWKYAATFVIIYIIKI